MKEGDKVLYNKIEKGIIKTIDGNNIFVVFNCGEDWSNYRNYTAQNTPVNSLSKGWSVYGTEQWCLDNGGHDRFIASNSKWSYEGEVFCCICGTSNR